MHELGFSAVLMSRVDGAVILVARVFLATLFLIFGWRKVRDFSGTVAQMVRDGAPTPVLAAGIATFMELPVAFAVAVGAFTRPAAVLFFLYTLGTSLVEHRYWAQPSPQRLASMEEFYKNLSIMGGFALLFVTGAGRYSIDGLFGLAAP
jgi:putative oxidoreductase